MKAAFAIVVFLVACSLVTISVCSPETLSKNSFLDGFINHEILNIIALIVTVTLVSITQIHIEFGRIERRIKEPIFSEARTEINQTTWALGVSFLLVLVGLIIRSGVDQNSYMAISLHNTFCLVMLLIATLSMIDIVLVMHTISKEEPLD
ncbi:hypothetical protein I6N98_02290 [Spongiibacter nanhainus]|uniref:Uncharacterized protein n=1 Tax=Spongiibacter nanhainus TaxID=2794344 RepID=A0A7T4R1Q3_9GAMM|nr:hypothetical protein [Spongiibacter nanhainus]QQD18719.1 hypothetical protein I6N98_02290 [Spongiibacter nanhainus]